MMKIKKKRKSIRIDWLLIKIEEEADQVAAELMVLLTRKPQQTVETLEM